MYRYIPNEKLEKACEEAAKSLNVDVEVFKRAVFEAKQQEYDRMDVEQWLQDEGFKYTDDDVETILNTYRDDYDADRGTWSNIESAYYNNQMHLEYDDGDDEPAGEEDGDDRAKF